LAIGPLTWQMVHVYDMPVMALWALALLLMVRRQWAWFWPVFILACLAKETAALMVLVFVAVALGRMDHRRLLGMAGGLAVIWGVIRLALCTFSLAVADKTSNRICLINCRTCQSTQ